MRCYQARLVIESQSIEYKTIDYSIVPVRNVSIDIVCGDRAEAHKAVDAFLDEYDEMVKIYGMVYAIGMDGNADSGHRL